MHKILLSIALFLIVMPSMAAEKNDSHVKRYSPTICEGKANAEEYVHALSDYELVRSITNVMADTRMGSLHSSNEVNAWLNVQPDCAVWTEGTYLLEVKWLHKEAVARGLAITINKIGQGSLRWNANRNRFEERHDNDRWVPWSTYQK